MFAICRPRLSHSNRVENYLKRDIFGENLKIYWAAHEERKPLKIAKGVLTSAGDVQLSPSPSENFWRAFLFEMGSLSLIQGLEETSTCVKRLAWTKAMVVERGQSFWAIFVSASFSRAVGCSICWQRLSLLRGSAEGQEHTAIWYMLGSNSKDRRWNC